MPAAAALGLAVQVSTAPAVPVAGVIANVTFAELVVIVLPDASWIVTFGWVVHATAKVPPFGCCANATFAAAPTVTFTEAVPVLVGSIVSFTVIVWLGTVLRVTPLLNVCTPLSAGAKV